MKSPILTLEIHSKDGSEYELEEEDIKEVFQRFGEVKQVLLRPNCKALIVFSEGVNAAFALNSLNNHEIEDIEVILKVDWCPLNEIPLQNKETPSMNEETLLMNLMKEDIEKTSLMNEETSLIHHNSIDYDEKIKYTCRFEIQIENEREFQVCRKIIGPKGINMKQIIEYCCNNTHNTEENPYFNDQIKLRLRGKGSGYKEGLNQIGIYPYLHINNYPL